MSSSFFCDPRRFLHAIEKRKCLYDITHPDYRDREVTENKWHEIAQEFDLSDVRIAKMRWKNMKDSYIKHKKSTLTAGRLSHNYRNWRWAKFVRFLDPFIYRSGRTFLLKKNSSQVTKTEDVSIDKEDKESGQLRNYLLKKRYSVSASEGESEEKVRNEAEFSEGDPLEPVMDVEVKAEPVSMESPESVRSDEVEHLFLSYAETFRRLPRRRQLVLKGQLASLFLRAELELLQDQGLATGAELASLQACFSFEQ